METITLSKSVGSKIVNMQVNSSFSGMLGAAELISKETGKHITFVGTTNENDTAIDWTAKDYSGKSYNVIFE